MTYDYQCIVCAHKWTVEQRITEEPLKSCPACKQETARRLISGKGGFVLRGTGWEKDGYG